MFSPCWFANIGWGVDFNSEIRPILSEHCLKCHGPDQTNRDSDFRIDSRQWATTDLGGYAGVVPGDPGYPEVVNIRGNGYFRMTDYGGVMAGSFRPVARASPAAPDRRAPNTAVSTT